MAASSFHAAGPRAASGSWSPASTSNRTTTTVSPRATLGRRHRLVHAADFDRVFREGQRSADRYFTVLYRDNGSSDPRLGFAISRQRVRLAVGRNRLRRLVRESFRHCRSGLPGLDIVVMARDGTAEAASTELRGSLERHWERLRQTPRPTRT